MVRGVPRMEQAEGVPTESLGGDTVQAEGHDEAEPIVAEEDTLLERVIRERDNLRAEMAALQGRLEDLQRKLWEATELNMALKKDRQSMSEEIMDLTKALFEEANGMVAAEARARASLEMDRKRLEAELQTTKEQLALERQQLHELRGRFASNNPAGGSTGAMEGSQDFAALAAAPRCPTQIDLRAIDALKCTIDQYSYFSCLLPRHRFNSRDRCDGPAGVVWDRISDNLARHDLPEFSRFVERSGGMDAETLLSHPYVRRMCETDVVPCLHFEFKPKPFVKRVALAMLKNTCCVERTPQAPSLPGGALSPTDGAHSRLSSAASVGTPGSMSVGAYPDSPVKSPLGGSGRDADDGAGGLLSPVAPSPESKRSPTAIENGSQRLRGIMSQFTTSVTSLPEALLANMTPATGGGTASGTQSVHSPSSGPAAAKFCALCGKSALHDSSLLQYRVRLSDSEAWMLIDHDCRERLVAAGHFFTFLRHLHSGLYSHRPLLDLYCDLLHFQRHMFYVRLAAGATMFFLQSDLESYLDMITPHLLSLAGRRTEDAAADDDQDHPCDDRNDDGETIESMDQQVEETLPPPLQSPDC